MSFNVTALVKTAFAAVVVVVVFTTTLGAPPVGSETVTPDDTRAGDEQDPDSSGTRESREVAPVIEFRDPDVEVRVLAETVSAHQGGIDQLGLSPFSRVAQSAPGLRAQQVAAARVNGQVSVTYVGAVPPEVQAVVDAAAGQWDSVLTLNPDAPLEIQFEWTPLGRGLLGQAGPNGQFRDPDEWPTNRWYPAALANAIDGSDVNGPAQPEISVELNSSLGAEWHTGLTTTPTFGQLDLYSVVLHEIGHGLGFLGSAFQSLDAEPSLDLNPPDIYDDLVYTSDGRKLVELGPASGGFLTSGSLTIDIGGGRQFPLHTPNRFVNGSSFSHFSEAIGNSGPGSMMTPALSNGELQRRTDAAVLGVLEGLGWRITPPPVTPVPSDVQLAGSSVSVLWTEDLKVDGTPAQTFRLEARHSTGVDSTIELPGVATSGQLSELLEGRDYTLAIIPVDRNGDTGVPGEASFRTGETLDRVVGIVVTGGSDAPVVIWPPVASNQAVTYDIQYRLGAGAWQNAGSTQDTELHLAPLTQGVYWFAVTPRTGASQGQRSVSPPIGLANGSRRPLPLDSQIERLYQAYFLRAPDPVGFEFWRNSALDGVSLPRMSAAFEGSAEFQQRYGTLNNSEFVGLVYRNVLSRDPDPGGANYWTGVLNGGLTRGRVMLQFSESTEYIEKTGTVMFQDSQQGKASRLYMAAFHRPGTVDEIEYWRQQFAAGLSVAAAAEQFAASAEFTEIYGGLNNDAFVTRLYQDLLGRNPAPAEHSAQMAALDSGTLRASVLAAFSQSREFILITGTSP